MAVHTVILIFIKNMIPAHKVLMMYQIIDKNLALILATFNT